MEKRDLIKRLKVLAQEQHAVLEKLAQMSEPLATRLPIHQTMDHGQEAAKILAALPASVKAAVDRLEVPAGSGEVKVRFHPGKGTQDAYNAVLNTVKSLQSKNELPGANYAVKVVS